MWIYLLFYWISSCTKWHSAPLVIVVLLQSGRSSRSSSTHLISLTFHRVSQVSSFFSQSAWRLAAAQLVLPPLWASMRCQLTTSSPVSKWILLWAELSQRCHPIPSSPSLTAGLIETAFMPHKQLTAVALIRLPVNHGIIKPAFPRCCHEAKKKKITGFFTPGGTCLV